MLMEVKKHFKLLITSFKYNIQKEMINKTSFIMQIVFMVLNNATFILQWVVLFNIKDNIGGYGLREVLILWALASSVYGFSHLFFENINELGSLIINGKIDVYLTQPKNVLFSIAVSKTKPSAIGDLLYGFIIILIIKPSIVSLSLFTLFTITGGIILTSFIALFSSLTFYFKKIDSLIDSVQHLILTTSTYPEGIFKGIIKLLLFTVVPIGFMIYIPIEVISNFNVYLLITIISFTIFLVIITFLVFHKGLKRYSSGNLMSSRI